MSVKYMKKFHRLIIIILMVSIFACLSFWGGIMEKEPEKVTIDPWVKKHWNHVKILSDVGQNVKVKKTILLWTKFFGVVNFVPKFSSLDCPISNCFVTSNRDYLNKSSAILFHLRDIDLKDMPSVRNKNQIWILLHHESPHHTPGILRNLDGVFNWTATYRYDSEIILSPLVKKRSKIIPKNYHFHRGKSKMAAWLVSNCITPSKRENFAKELQKTIPVDIYGSCGTHTCLPKMSDKCYEQLSSRYFFFLSFENSICKDYVTEKFFRILSTDMVPVVLSGANYSKIAPPNSYIDALSFKSPKALGKFLIKVAKNESMYNSYFEWRNTHYLDYERHYICSICRLLNASSIKYSTYFNISNWWFQDANCRSWIPSED